MRVFLSAFSGFTLAVPMDAVASIILYKHDAEKNALYDAEKIVYYDQENRNTYISLPRLFNLPDEDAYHGIVLREMNNAVNKVVLLTAEIKRDIEIPDEQFYPIPKALGGLHFSTVFSGVQFSGKPVLLLNTKQLVHSIEKEPTA